MWLLIVMIGNVEIATVARVLRLAYLQFDCKQIGGRHARDI
jgi:hypothetical protein